MYYVDSGEWVWIWLLNFLSGIEDIGIGYKSSWKNCRKYIFWPKKYQNIINRLLLNNKHVKDKKADINTMILVFYAVENVMCSNDVYINNSK
jgi:hypothetical protein